MRKCKNLRIYACDYGANNLVEQRFDRINFSVCGTVNSNTRKFFIVHSGIIEWNSLTNDIKLCSNIFCLNHVTSDIQGSVLGPLYLPCTLMTYLLNVQIAKLCCLPTM